MAYQPVHDPTPRTMQPAHFGDIELETRYDPGSHLYTPPLGRSPSHNTEADSKFDDYGDGKPFLRSPSETTLPSGNNRPIPAQQVATVTPLRAGLMFFDALLASTPIMFVGEFGHFLLMYACAKFRKPWH
jgi:hypothetical protein